MVEVPRRLPRAEREEQLLGVAQAVFAERGFRAPSMDEIALRAGVTKPVLYDHFGSKDGLVAACIRRTGARLLDTIAAAVETAPTAEESLRLGLYSFFTFVEAHGAGWFVLIGEHSVVGPAGDAVEWIRRQQADYVARRLGLLFPTFDPDSLEAFGHAIIGACERVALWRRERTDVSVGRATDSVMSLVWGGLAGALPG